MRRLSLPPKEKVLEALSCIADGRIFVQENRARVLSSTGKKEYEVELFPEQRKVKSSDPATRWQHYYGYPVIALLMENGLISFDPEIAHALKGIPWKKWNEENKKKQGKEYHKASFEQALDLAKEREADPDRIREFVEKVLKELEEQGLET